MMNKRSKAELKELCEKQSIQIRTLKLKIINIQAITEGMARLSAENMARLSALIPDIVSCQRLEVISNLLNGVVNDEG